VTLLLSLALVGAISPPEMTPSAEVPPVETSPTSAEAPLAPSESTAEVESPAEVEAAVAPDEVPPGEAPSDETVPAKTPPRETRHAETDPVAAEAPSHSAATPPGGYWTFAEQHERSREPLDGDDELTIGSVLFSLGILRAGAGVLTAMMANDTELCPLTEPRGCDGLRNYGWAGVAEGGLMIGTGITYLAIGATRRQRHRRWERGEAAALWHPGAALNVVDVGPWLIPRSRSGISEVRVGGAGLRLQLRF
jgi:hypothetical protein